MKWYVYMMECADGSLYTGVATDLKKRVDEHNGILPGGARYTRARQPVKLIYSERVASRTEATRREYAIKQMTRGKKLKLI